MSSLRQNAQAVRRVLQRHRSRQRAASQTDSAATCCSPWHFHMQPMASMNRIHKDLLPVWQMVAANFLAVMARKYSLHVSRALKLYIGIFGSLSDRRPQTGIGWAETALWVRQLAGRVGSCPMFTLFTHFGRRRERIMMMKSVQQVRNDDRYCLEAEVPAWSQFSAERFARGEGR